MQLISGQKLALNQIIQNDAQFSLRIQFKAAFDIDISCFGLGENNKLYHDDYMTFYNQPQTPKGEIKYSSQNDVRIFHINLSQIAAKQTPRFVICATVDHAYSTMHDIQSAQVELVNQLGQIVATYTLDAKNFSQEKAIMLTEIYFKTDQWRMAAIGQGFNGGLNALVEHFGGDIKEQVATQVKEKISNIDLKKKVVLDKIEKSAPHLLDLTKKSLLSLEKNHLLNVQARVALVLDYSGSMNKQYKNGDVQKVLDRIMPLALNFDDDASFECWAFAQKPLRLNDVNLNNLNQFIETDHGGHKNWDAGARYNNEPDVLEAVVKYFTEENPSQLPVYVVFISDGGVSETKKIKQILKNASSQPIFWQFVGIGGRSYGVLEQLDTMDGRVVDNCNFFEIENIQSITETKLYDLLLQEFPIWLKEAKVKNILKD